MSVVYGSPAAFKQALEARLRGQAAEAGLTDPNRHRRRLLLDRFCARVFAELGDRVVLKGGMVVELRVGGARMTRDLDLRVIGGTDDLLPRLQAAGRLDLGDRLRFEVRADPRHPEIRAEGMTYDGRRFRVSASLAGRPYGGPFGVDAVYAEPMVGEPELLDGSDFLSFAGVERPQFAVYPIETHVAEKLHAYTVPRSRPNSRVKDLPDIALLATVRPVEAATLRAALDATWGHRRTHPMPGRVPEAPETWGPIYLRLASSSQLPWATLPELMGAVRSFLDPVLADGSGSWDPVAGEWGP